MIADPANATDCAGHSAEVIDIEPYLVARRYGSTVRRNERGWIVVDHNDGSGLASVWGMVWTEEAERRWAEEEAAYQKRRAAALRGWETRRTKRSAGASRRLA